MRRYMLLAILFFATACIRVEVNADENLSFDFKTKVRGEVTLDTTIKFEVDHPGKFSFELENINGDIRAFRSPGREIKVVLMPSENAYERLKVYRYEDEDEAGIYVKSRKKYWKWKNFDEYRIDINVFLPEGIGKLEISTVNGDIHCFDDLVGGDIEISAVNGRIKGRIKGESIDLSSVNGRINTHLSAEDISVSNVNGGLVVDLEKFNKTEISNVNGSIRVTVYRNHDFRGEISTVTGSIDIDDVEESPFLKHLEKSRSIVGKSYEFILGSGTSKLEVSNVNGSIRINLEGGTI